MRNIESLKSFRQQDFQANFRPYYGPYLHCIYHAFKFKMKLCLREIMCNDDLTRIES